MNMYENRNVADIIKPILEIIPKTETQLIIEITNFNCTLWNQSPESLKSWYCWSQLVSILNEFIPIVSEEWQINVQCLMKNK
jgi:hypothetical protein